MPVRQAVDVLHLHVGAPAHYLARLSGPLLDRMDIVVQLPPITRQEVMSERGSNESTARHGRPGAAGTRARRRPARRHAVADQRRCAADDPQPALADPPAPAPAGKAMDQGLLTARGFGRVQRLAWTLADLDGRDVPSAGDVGAALGMRLGDLDQGLAA